jgi:hypothetical protein
LHYTLDAQMCLQPHSVPLWKQSVSIINTVPSPSALTSQKTHNLSKIFGIATKWLIQLSTSKFFLWLFCVFSFVGFHFNASRFMHLCCLCS